MLTPKQRINDLLRRKTLLAANLVLLALVAWGFGGEFLRNRDMRQEIERLRAQADSLESKNFGIAKIGRELASTDALEREARLKLGLQKPGESVIIIQDIEPPPPPKTAAAAQPESRPRVSNAVKWWRYFFENNN